jgi:hypothetical protein
MHLARPHSIDAYHCRNSVLVATGVQGLAGEMEYAAVSMLCLLQEAGSPEALEAAMEAAAIASRLTAQLDEWDLRVLLGGPYDEKVLL